MGAGGVNCFFLTFEMDFVVWLIFKVWTHEMEILLMAESYEFNLGLMFRCSLFSSEATAGVHKADLNFSNI